MDDEILVSFSGKKKRLISSSSSDDDQNVVRQKGDNTRSSERIRKRQKRTFSLPSRDDIWRDIPNEKHVEKEIRKLTPKKLINNFTKENNRYNYDPVYTSGEESLCDFIDDESSSGTSESESELRKKRHKRKVKHYHPRIVKESSSDTDSEGNKNKLGGEETDSEIEVKLRRNSAKSKSKCIVSDSEHEDSRQCLAVSNGRKKLYDDSDCKGSEQNDSEDDVIAAIDRNRGLIIEDSDDDDDDDVGENDTQSEVKVEMTQTQLNVNVGTDAESAGAVQNGKELVAKVKVEPDILNVDNERNRLDIVNKNSETEIKVENNAHQVAVKFKERNNDSVNASLEGTSENKCETTRHDSGILADCEGFEASDSNESTSSSENEEDCESSDSDVDKSSDTDKDVVSERTRVSMVKKRKKKEKLFQKFREARALKLQKEVNRRKSETKSEAGDRQTEKTD